MDRITQTILIGYSDIVKQLLFKRVWIFINLFREYKFVFTNLDAILASST